MNDTIRDLIKEIASEVQAAGGRGVIVTVLDGKGEYDTLSYGGYGFQEQASNLMRWAADRMDKHAAARTGRT